MSNADRERWNQKYAKKLDTPSEAPPILLQNLSYFQAGTVLDVACGDGAAALFLARQAEFEVTALDISDVAINRLQQFARQQQLKVNTLCFDLEDATAFSDVGEFNNICLFRFKPTAELLVQIARLLAEKGRLIIATFNQLHHQQTGFNPRFCLQPEELLFKNQPFLESAGLRLISYHSSEQSPFCDSYIFEKSL